MIKRICFVCLGNICRSPLADGIARQEIHDRGLELSVGSAGTGGWHVGDPPDPRMRQTARAHGLSIDDLRAEQVTAADQDRYDLFVAMDQSNFRNLQRIFADAPQVKIVKLLDFHGGPEQDVPDPYYGGDDGFETVFELVTSGVGGLLDAIESGQLND